MRKDDIAGFCNDMPLLSRVDELWRKEMEALALSSPHFDKIRPDSCNFSLFPMEITVNGKKIEKASIESIMSEYDICTEYLGNRLGIKVSKLYLPSPENFISRLSVAWYGIPINQNQYSFSDAYRDVFLVVETNSPVTPVLPFRHAIKNDEKLMGLYNFVITEVIKYCTSLLDNPEGYDKYKLLEASEILSKHASQSDLDKLSHFCITSSEPYYNTEPFSGSPRNIVVADRNTPIINEGVRLYIDGEEDEEQDGLFLPEGVIVTVDVPEKKPSWLRVENKEYIINISTTGNEYYSGYYEWEKSVISCNGKDIKILALVPYAGDGTVYYSEKPDDFYGISDAIFAQIEYYEDGDSYDSQEYYFSEKISEDIQNITGQYRLQDVFKGFYDVLGIRGSDIVEVVFKRDAKSLAVKTESQERVFVIV